MLKSHRQECAIPRRFAAAYRRCVHAILLPLPYGSRCRVCLWIPSSLNAVKRHVIVFALCPSSLSEMASSDEDRSHRRERRKHRSREKHRKRDADRHNEKRRDKGDDKRRRLEDKGDARSPRKVSHLFCSLLPYPTLFALVRRAHAVQKTRHVVATSAVWREEKRARKRVAVGNDVEVEMSDGGIHPRDVIVDIVRVRGRDDCIRSRKKRRRLC